MIDLPTTLAFLVAAMMMVAAVIDLPTTLNPASIAKRYGCKNDTVISWIKSGELRAIDVSSPESTRPRYRIDPDDLAAFENRRSVQARPKIQRRRRRKDPRFVEYF